MMAGVRDLEEARAAFEPLREHSYHYATHRPGTHWFISVNPAATSGARPSWWLKLVTL